MKSDPDYGGVSIVPLTAEEP